VNMVGFIIGLVVGANVGLVVFSMLKINKK
jgi:hypothetical protein